jgi:hypothetical protein
MSCPICRAVEQMEFSAEMVVHHVGLKNLGRPDVLVFSQIFVCAGCGFSQFTVPKAELASLASDSPNRERLTMAAAG